MRSFLRAIALSGASPRLTSSPRIPLGRASRPTNGLKRTPRQVLAKSPWARQISAVITRRLTEDQLREAGQMGQPRGVGNEGVDPKGSGPKVSPNVFSGPGGDDRGARGLFPSPSR